MTTTDPARMERRRKAFAEAGPMFRAFLVANIITRDDPMFEEFQDVVLREQRAEVAKTSKR